MALLAVANDIGHGPVNPATGVATLTHCIQHGWNPKHHRRLQRRQQLRVQPGHHFRARGRQRERGHHIFGKQRCRRIDPDLYRDHAINGNATLGTPIGTVVFTLTSATTGAVIGSSAAINLSGSGTSATALWTGPALTSHGSYFVTITYTPAGGSGYNALAIDTVGSTNGTAFVETAKQAFTPGNLVAVQRGDGNINLGSSGYLVFLDEYTTAGTLVQRVALPNLDAGTAHALVFQVVRTPAKACSIARRTASSSRSPAMTCRWAAPSSPQPSPTSIRARSPRLPTVPEAWTLPRPSALPIRPVAVLPR